MKAKRELEYPFSGYRSLDNLVKLVAAGFLRGPAAPAPLRTV